VPSKFVIMTERVTFLVDADGNIAQVWPEVDPAVDAKRVQEAEAERSSISSCAPRG
jgi:peroxiredoxin